MVLGRCFALKEACEVNDYCWYASLLLDGFLEHTQTDRAALGCALLLRIVQSLSDGGGVLLHRGCGRWCTERNTIVVGSGQEFNVTPAATERQGDVAKSGPTLEAERRSALPFCRWPAKLGGACSSSSIDTIEVLFLCGRFIDERKAIVIYQKHVPLSSCFPNCPC